MAGPNEEVEGGAVNARGRAFARCRMRLEAEEDAGGSSRSRRGRQGSGDAGEAREARVARIRARKALDGRRATDPGDEAVVKLQGHGGLLRFPVQSETEKERVENGEGKAGREKEGKKKGAGEVGPGSR